MADISYKYVLIKSHLGNQSYLDVAGGKKNPGTHVITWSHHGDANQVWFYDAVNQTFRSKMNDFCLEFLPGKNTLVLNPFNPHNPHQKWIIHLPHIKLMADPRMVISVIDDNSSKEAKVSALPEGGRTGQQWSFEDAGGYAQIPADFTQGGASIGGGAHIGGGANIGGAANNGSGAHIGGGDFGGQAPKMDFNKREFVISSAMSGDLVLDIRGDNEKEGASVIVYTTNRKKNQLWYCDNQGYVRSALNDMVFEGSSKGSSLKMTRYQGDRKHQWRLEGRKVVNGEGYCLDIRGGKGKKGEELCAYDYKGDENQHWNILY